MISFLFQISIFWSLNVLLVFVCSHTMGITELWLLLSIMLATSAAAVDQQSYIIHMDTTKMATTNPQQWYTSIIDTVNQLSSINDDQNEASNAAEILYIYKTAISGKLF